MKFDYRAYTTLQMHSKKYSNDTAEEKGKTVMHLTKVHDI
jgi:hypothetical protein